MLEVLRRGRSVTQLAWAYRSVRPEAGFAEFEDFLQAPAQSEARIAELYDGSDPLGLSISDHGRVAGIDPLELWLATYVYRYPGAPQQDLLDASASVRQAAADRYDFTSALPPQILQMLGPTLESLMTDLTSEPCRSVRPDGQTDRAPPSRDTCRSPQ